MYESPAKASRELLETLRAPPGTVNVRFKKTSTGGHFIVMFTAGARLKPDRRPVEFSGHPVLYHPRRTAEASKAG